MWELKTRLFLPVIRYVISTLELMVAEDYMIVYLNGATPRRKMPGLGWMKKCYQMKLKKRYFLNCHHSPPLPQQHLFHPLPQKRDHHRPIPPLLLVPVLLEHPLMDRVARPLLDADVTIQEKHGMDMPVK